MLIVGELINSSRKAIQPAIENRDAGVIQELALKQTRAGAAYVDVNCGTQLANEAETMQWLIASIQAVSDAPLCIDSPSEEAIAAGLAAARKNGKQQMVNSITAERNRFGAILPLVLEHKTKVVALCMDDNGMPETAVDRIRIVDRLLSDLTSNGVPEDDIYVDPLVKPISVGDKVGVEVLDAVRYIRETYPHSHTVCGLSNVSFGLPQRKIINRAFLVQSMAAGMDAFILDPLDREIMSMVYASRALLGQDEFCSAYLKAHRAGMLVGQ